MRWPSLIGSATGTASPSSSVISRTRPTTTRPTRTASTPPPGRATPRTACPMRDAAKDAAGAAKGAMKDASDSVKDASDAARERLEGIGELIRDAIREWSKASGDRKVDARLDEIAQRLRSAVPASTFKTTVTRLERELPDTDKDRYDRAYERGRVQTRTMYVVGGLAVGIGAGLAAALLLDPSGAQERRARSPGRRCRKPTRSRTARRAHASGEGRRGRSRPRPAGEAGGDDEVGSPGPRHGPGHARRRGPVTDPSPTVREPRPVMPLASSGAADGHRPVHRRR